MRRVVPVLLLALALSPVLARPADAQTEGVAFSDINVTTTADTSIGGDGLTSLREAFAQASTDGAPSRILLFADDFDLTCAGGGVLYHDESQTVRVVGMGATVRQTCATSGVFYDNGPLLELQNLTVTGGGVVGGAAAVFGQHGHLDAVTVEGNVGSGGVRFDGTSQQSTITNSLIRDNHTAGSGGGALTFGELRVVDSVFEDNTAVFDGAAIEAFDDLEVVGSTIGPDNVADSLGGGIATSADLEIDDSTLHDNGANPGGGAFANGTMTVANTTVRHNSATNQGGGLRSAGLMTLDHVTVTDNSSGADGANLMFSSGLTIGNSVVSGFGSGYESCSNFGGSFTSSGHNLFEPFCGTAVASDLTGDAGLGLLRDNGSPPTMFPLAGSPLIDAIPGSCTQAADERGVARPFAGGCDIGAVEAVYPAHAFTDVPGWVEDAVRWMTSTVNDPPLMTGITPTRFKPNDPITRAQVVRQLYREAGSPPVGALPPHGFTDVPGWVEDAVRWAKANTIATGITPTTFVPNDPITRAQVVRMKYRLAGEPAVVSLPLHGFSDVPPWVEDAVRWGANTDNPLPLLTGYDNGTFRPNLDITRAQVVRMDYRLAITPAAWDDPGTAPATLPFVGT